MMYFVYALIILSSIWIASRFKLIHVVLSIMYSLSYQWQLREEILCELQNKKIPDHFWLFVIPSNFKEFKELVNFHKNRRSRLFVFVYFDIDDILMLLEDIKLVQKRVAQNMTSSEAIIQVADLLEKLRKEMNPGFVDDILPQDKVAQIKNIGRNSDFEIEIYQWRKVAGEKRIRKKDVFRQFAFNV